VLLINNACEAAPPAVIVLNTKLNASAAAVTFVLTLSIAPPIILDPATFSVTNCTPVPIPTAAVPLVVCLNLTG
jgi:hypothetical protein